MYADSKGTAELVCKDGSSVSLPDTLYVPGLGVNLLSARRMCESGLHGTFNDRNMYFRAGQKIMIRAKIDSGLYIAEHVSRELNHQLQSYKKCTAFASMDIDSNSTTATLHDLSAPSSSAQKYEHSTDTVRENLNQSDVDRYLLWHRRFAHLGPEKIRNLRKVTTLREAIKIPKLREICEICQLTKMTNRIPKELADHKTQRLALIQFDIAGPFPKTLRGNRYFLLIVDRFTRMNWILLLRQKSDAPKSLRISKPLLKTKLKKK
ncbi:hypothetical protein K3495_g13624 [Podosphaera aphanis]|nr:hypothetical protein K3495_g13624 [Podosphaera aphanis]